MKVPFLDLKVQYESIKEEIATAVQEVMNATAFAGGPFVKKFEAEFAQFCQTEQAVGVSSGTSALWLALRALGVSPGDEVITTPNTFIATAEAISFCGATPVFVDVDELSYNLDPALLESAITPRTKAIIPVHLFGQMADMDAIMEIARRHNLYVIEDACQAHGAEYKGRRAGSMGDLGCFSFYPGKNLGAYGEAGAVVTNRKDLADKIRMIRDHGQAKKYYHDVVGWNARMDGIQAAVLNVKLKHIEKWTEMRRQNAMLYNELLKNIEDVITPVEMAGARHVYHLYALRAAERENLIEYLKERDIHCGIHYPVPLHLQQAYRFLGYNKGDFPVAEKSSAEFVSLPMYPELSREQIEFVVSEIKQFISQNNLRKDSEQWVQEIYS
jgi:dTDP-4-amino-4,6-dideoxygalactose transaminase